MGFPESYVQRLGLSEIRVLTIHISSYSFHHSIQRVRQLLRSIFSKAIMTHVDFITGDFNLFANRQFKTDTGGSHIGGVVVEVLKNVVRAMNIQLQQSISYNVSSSTPPQDVFDFVAHNEANANLDCMLFISLFHNKQQYTAERPPKIVDHLCLAHDYIHNISERPRQLSTYDLCLKRLDGDWHVPLIVRVSAHATRNKRTRGALAQGQRNQRYRDWWNSYERQEPHHFQNYGRYYGEYHRQDAGPYTRASSSSGHQWDAWYGGWR